jgi:hypothetical protein
VLHEGLRRALFRWLDRGDEAAHPYVLRLDERRFAYVDVADTPLVATSLRWVDDTALLGLTDGSEEPLDPATLTVDGAGVLRARVRGGRLDARLGPAAVSALSERVESEGDVVLLRAAGQRLPIARR